MIRTIRKSLLLTAAIAAMAAMAVPSMASAANWGPVGTYHNLSSPSSITFDTPTVPGGATLTCASGPTFAGLVRTPASPLMDLTSTTTNIPCTGTGGFAGWSNIKMDVIGLPVWSVDGTSGTNNVKINSVNIELKAGTTPTTFGTMTGTLTGGVWSNLTRTLAFSSDTGLTFTVGGIGWPATVTASEFIKDTTSPFLTL